MCTMVFTALALARSPRVLGERRRRGRVIIPDASYRQTNGQISSFPRPTDPERSYASRVHVPPSVHAHIPPRTSSSELRCQGLGK